MLRWFILISILPKDLPPRALKEAFANLESLLKILIRGVNLEHFRNAGRKTELELNEFFKKIIYYLHNIAICSIHIKRFSD